MPVPEGIYHGVDLTSMEVAMYESQTKFKSDKKAAFTPKAEEKEKEREKEKEKGWKLSKARR